MPQSTLAQENFADLNFPLQGLDLSTAFSQQREGTTPVASNVRAYDASGRARGGSRPGLAKWSSAQLNSGTSIQDLAAVTVPSGATLMQPGRAITLLVCTAGKLYSLTTTTATLINATHVSSTAPVIFSATNNLVQYYVDGTTTYRKYTLSTTTAANWTAAAGSLPSGGGEGCRLIENWRGRVVLSALRSDPQNWFMSAVDAPTDFDYSPVSTTPTQAVAGNNSDAGLVGDVVNTMIPYSDDVLVFGCDHSIWLMNGDPAAGGQIDRVSDTIGMAWGRPWCKAPDGTLFFFANRGGVFVMTPGQQPQRITQQINELLQVNLATNLIRMAWDDRAQGLHLFVTPLTSTTATIHFFWEQRTGAWFEVVFANKNHNPKVAFVFDGDDPDDRAVLLGSWDGYVRMFDATAVKDDGTTLTSSVVIGPLLTRDMDELLVKDMQALLGEDSGDVTYGIYVGQSAEQALSSDPVIEGTWSGGRNFTNHVRRSGHAVFVKITATTSWSFEMVRIRLAGLGKVRRRGK